MNLILFRRSGSIFFYLFILSTYINAQDIQFSQYFTADLYLNPAFAGSMEASRLSTQQRIQWPQADAYSLSSSFSYDHNFKSINSGFGLIGYHHTLGKNNSLKQTKIACQYAYAITINPKWAMRFGLEIGRWQNQINPNNLIFGDQLSNFGITNTLTKEKIDQPKIQGWDISSGGNLYTDNFWLSLSFHHLNQPNRSFLKENDELPIRTSINLGYKIPLNYHDPSHNPRTKLGYIKELSLVPTLLFQKQQKHDQLNLGMYLIADIWNVGIWYRGVPFKNYETQEEQYISNYQALVLMLGVKIKQVRYGYSYDVNTSGLKNTGGAHEFSISYEFNVVKGPQKGKSAQKRLPCPKHSPVLRGTY